VKDTLRGGEEPVSSLGHGLSLRQEHKGLSQGGRSRRKGDSRRTLSNRQPAGHSCGGLGGKICLAVDVCGKALLFILTPVLAHELLSALSVLNTLPTAPRYIIYDLKYASTGFVGICEADFRGRSFLPKRMSRPVRASNKPIGTTTWSQIFGLGSGNGEPLVPDTRNPSLPSSLYSAPLSAQITS